MTMGPRKGPGPGRFPNLDLRVPDSFEARGRPYTAIPAPYQRVFDGRESGEHIGVSHEWLGPPYRPGPAHTGPGPLIRQRDCKDSYYGDPPHKRINCFSVLQHILDDVVRISKFQ